MVISVSVSADQFVITEKITSYSTILYHKHRILTLVINKTELLFWRIDSVMDL